MQMVIEVDPNAAAKAAAEAVAKAAEEERLRRMEAPTLAALPVASVKASNAEKRHPPSRTSVSRRAFRRVRCMR